MARVAKVLKPLEVKALADTVKKHNVGGVDGTLLLVVSKTKTGNLARSWVFISRKSGLKFEGGDCHEFCVHGIIGARYTGTPHEHDYQETNLS